MRWQQGAALLVTLALIGVIAGLSIVWMASTAAIEAKRTQESAKAMGMIRDALVARAAGDLNRPGSLPCPDVDNDGQSLGPGPEWTGSNCTSYIGRVPWKTLDLPDLHDENGERFWYALSSNFRDSSNGGPLNSDTTGSLSVTGTPTATNVVAIIIAPGPSLPGQNRDPANTNVLSELPNYLDGDNNNADNVYQAGPETSTFNDKLLVITRDMLMPAVEQRVARQARRCLENFAASAGGRYPFAAPMTEPLPITSPAWATFADEYPVTTTALSGRIPSMLDATNAAMGSPSPALTWPADDPPDPSHPGPCFRSSTTSPSYHSWWDDWRELLLYRVSAAYAPSGTVDCATGPCLSVNGYGGVKFVVIVAGRALTPAPPDNHSTNQLLRGSNKTNSQYYLEQFSVFSNIAGLNFASSFGKAPRAVTTGPLGGFNDRVECVSESGAAPCD